MSHSSARDRATVTVTVLGCVSPYPGLGTAGPGYLVEGFGSRILLDCGSGVLSRLREYCDYPDLDAVILSHLHFDHCSDMLVLRYALDAAARTGRLVRPVPVWCPAEPEVVAGFMSYKEALVHHTIESARPVTVAGMTITFHPARHPVETYHVAFAPAKAPAVGPVLFYTADTEWYEELPAIAGRCRVLIAEATSKQRPGVGHMTPGQAARLGEVVGAERTILTHYPPERVPAELEAEALEASNRPVTVATEGLRITWP